MKLCNPNKIIKIILEFVPMKNVFNEFSLHNHHFEIKKNYKVRNKKKKYFYSESSKIRIKSSMDAG